MSKKKRKVPKSGAVWQLSAEEATLVQMPRYNAHICKTGVHGPGKYDRAKAKRTWQKEAAAQKTADWRSFCLAQTAYCTQPLTLQLSHGDDGLGAVAHAELGIDVVDVVLHGGQA